MEILGVLILVSVLSLVKSSFSDLDEEFFKNVLDETYKVEKQYDRQREKKFIYTIWPKISLLIPESVKIPKFREHIGMDYLCASEAYIWPKVGKILDIGFETGDENNNYIVEAELDFTHNLDLEVYKESSSKQKFPPVSLIYSFEGPNTVKFWIRIPNFSKKPKDEISAECAVFIDSFAIEKLSDPKIDESKVKDIESKLTEKMYWDSVKEGVFRDIVRISIMRSLVDKLLLTGQGNKKSWVCLGSHIKHKVLRFINNNYKNDKTLENEDPFNKGKKQDVSDDQITYVKISISDVVKSIQVAVKTSVTSAESQPKKEIFMSDFSKFVTNSLVPDPSERSFINFFSTYRLHTYAPVAFRHLRDFFGIETDQFVASFCNYPLRKFSSPGASGSTLLMTEDKSLIAKTTELSEGGLLLRLLPGYFLHLYQSPHTLLPKFFGLYMYERDWEQDILVITNNVFPPNIKINQQFDLKGSKFRREASKQELEKPSPTYRDIDFMRLYPQGIYLNPDDLTRLIDTIKRDCEVLESFDIMDYSLLLGIHYIEQPEEANPGEEEETFGEACEGNYDLADESNSEDRNKNVQGEGPENIKLKQYQSENNKHKNIASIGIPGKTARGKDLVLFVGIIDVLQSYEIDHMAQHLTIRLLTKKEEISLQEPEFYAKRFVRFLEEKVFKSFLTCRELKLKSIITNSLKTDEEGNSKTERKNSIQEEDKKPKRIRKRDKVKKALFGDTNT